ncbi:hypothetical protein [Sanguibacter gelidistatuariae]|nr:hypothetical protein [Sanguibacter gelidistatuariae]
MNAHHEGLDASDHLAGPDRDGLDGQAEEVARRLHSAHPEFDEVRLLEDDETIPPRPEELVADASRE